MKRLALIGGGNMGEALVSGLLRSGYWKSTQITVADVRVDQLKKLKRIYRISVGSDNSGTVRGAEIILLAIKPQQMAPVLQEIGSLLRPRQLVLSIAAGISTAFIESFLTPHVPVVRVMPNTPALVGAGAAALARGRWAKASHEKMAHGIFSTVGAVVSVPEKEMNAVTAVSGSGPAYLFYLAEAMLESARALGLAPRVAEVLVRQTLRGSGMLLAQSEEEPNILRQRVTSPGGTTEAAVKILDQAKVRTIWMKAIKRACQRARELSQT